MFAVIFDLEGQFDCTLHETKAGADAEAARLSEKYAAERASYSASVAVQAVQLPPAYIEAPAMLAALRQQLANAIERRDRAPVYNPKDGSGSKADHQAEIDSLTAILARIDGTPTDEEPAHNPDCPAVDGFGCRCDELGDYTPSAQPADPTKETASELERYTVRIDACFSYEIEAEDEDSAIEQAEAQFDKDQTGGRITETLVFEGED